MRMGLFLAAALAVAAGIAGAASAAEERWVVVYSEKPGVAEFRDYGLVVLDSVHHPPIRPLLEQKKTVIGYISLGEVENYRDYYKAVDPEHRRRQNELNASRAPLPVDTKLQSLKNALTEVSKPVPVDPTLEQMRRDVEMSVQQAAFRRLTAAQDIAWALINSPAFLFNH